MITGIGSREFDAEGRYIRADFGKEDRAVYPRLLAVDNEIVVPVNTTGLSRRGIT